MIFEKKILPTDWSCQQSLDQKYKSFVNSSNKLEKDTSDENKKLKKIYLGLLSRT